MDFWKRSPQPYLNNMLPDASRATPMMNLRIGMTPQNWPVPQFPGLPGGMPVMPDRMALTQSAPLLKPSFPDFSYMSLLMENQLLKSKLNALGTQGTGLGQNESKPIKIESQPPKIEAPTVKIEVPAIKEPVKVNTEPKSKAIAKPAKLQQQVSESVSESSNQPTEEKPQTSTEKGKKKRYRRLAEQVQRTSCCPYPNCGKSYGAEGTLHQHIRIKHPDFDLLAWIHEKIKAANGK